MSGQKRGGEDELLELSQLLQRTRLDEDADLEVSEMAESELVFLEAASVDSECLADLKCMLTDVSYVYNMSPRESLEISMAVLNRQNRHRPSTTSELISPMVAIKEDLDCHVNYGLL